MIKYSALKGDIMENIDNNYYLEELGNIPKLSKAEKKEYFELLKEIRKNIKKTTNISKKAELEKKYFYYRNLLVSERLPWVYSMASKYANDDVSVDELVEVGNLLLVEEFDKADCDCDYFYKIKLYQDIRRAILIFIKNRNIEKEQATRVLYTSTDSYDIDDIVYYKVLEDYIEAAIESKLTEREKIILRMYYGIQDKECPKEEFCHEHTLLEISRFLGFTKSRIGMHIDEILGSLQKYAIFNGLNDYFGITYPKKRIINFELRINHLRKIFLKHRSEVLQIINNFPISEQIIIYLVLNGAEIKESEEVLRVCFKVRSLIGYFVYTHPEIHKSYIAESQNREDLEKIATEMVLVRKKETN